MANVKFILTFDDGSNTREGSARGTQRVLSTLENNPTGHARNAVFFIQTHAMNDQFPFPSNAKAYLDSHQPSAVGYQQTLI